MIVAEVRHTAVLETIAKRESGFGMHRHRKLRIADLHEVIVDLARRVLSGPIRRQAIRYMSGSHDLISVAVDIDQAAEGASPLVKFSTVGGQLESHLRLFFLDAVGNNVNGTAPERRPT